MRFQKTLPLAAFALAFSAGACALAQEAAPLRGKIEAVTVYRGQALVTRLVDVPAPAGLKEIVIGDLPDQVVPGSIYAEATAADGVEVRSVSYRVRPVEKDVRDEVRKLDDQIRAVQDKIAANQSHRAVLAEERAYLAKLEQFIAPTATVEMTKGVLDAATVQKLTAFQFEQRAKLADDDLRLGLELRGLTEQQDTLQRQRNQVAGSSARLAREAVVFVNLTKAPGSLHLRYVVNSATWSPSYNVRTDKDHKQIAVEYLASIQQMSGEDWPAVTMTLSTATPSLVATSPMLTELRIALARTAGPLAEGDELERNFGNKDYGLVKENLKQQKLAQETFRANNGSIQFEQQAGQSSPNSFTGNNAFNSSPNLAGSFNRDQDQGLNDAAGQLQLLDIWAKEKVARKPDGRPVASADEGYSVTYTLGGRTTLPSRSDRQLIQIASSPFKAEYSKTAIPVLTSFVYDEASLSNDGQSVLLAGPVSTYVDGQFVGQGFIPSVAVGEKFTVGLGIDSSLRATRELVEKTETTQGGNRVIDFTYRLRLENFSGKPATVRLMDRLPTAKESELRVTLSPPGKDGKDLSKDATYEQTERKKGMLRWDVEVPAQAIGVKAMALEYQFRLEYDKMMTITTPMPAKK